MGDGEDSSWLSSVIDRFDTLALTIGGYEDDKPLEYRFSDDESDSSSSSTDDDDDDDDSVDSGFEDALASRTWPNKAQIEMEALEHGKAPLSSMMTAKRSRPNFSEREPLVSSAEKGPSLSVTQPQSSQEHLDAADVRASEEVHPRESLEGLASEHPGTARSSDKPPSVSVTPSHKQDLAGGGVPDLDGKPPAGDDITNPTFSTPAHRRERGAFNRGLPLAAPPLASSAGSRRVHRVRKCSNEGLKAKSPMGMHIVEEAAPVRASPSEASRLLRRKNKKYSHVSDTTWLKPKGDTPETTPTPLELESVDVAIGRAPVQANRPSAPAEEFSASDYAATVDLVVTARVAQASTGRRNRHRSPLDMEQYCMQDLPAEVCGEAETDLQVEKLSGEDLGVRAEDIKLICGENVVMGSTVETVALARLEDSPAPSEDLTFDVPQRQIDANEHDETYERENGVGHVDVDQDGSCQEEGQQGRVEEKDGVEPPEFWNKGVGMIGSKRASAENGVGTQEEDWTLDSPEWPAPSKRGKMQSERPLAVMRHSSRLDEAIFERHRRLGAMTAGNGSEEDSAKNTRDTSKGLEDGEADKLAAVPWPDRELRPYDSPIVDTDLPARQAKALGRLGMGSQTLIVSSPFRRCLQTAGVVARTLGVASVTVNLQVGERMDKVRKEIAELALANEEKAQGTFGNKRPAPVFSYLEEADMREALGAGVQLEGIVGQPPPEEESGIEAKQRFIAAITKVREEQLRDSPVLMVAHGDTLDAAGESLASQIVFEADYCAWALFHLDQHSGYVIESFGIQMIPL